MDDGQRGCDQFNPTAVMDNDGTVYAAWQECRNGDGDIYFAHSTNTSQLAADTPVTVTWSTPVRVNDDVGHTWQYDPAMALGQDGPLYLVWGDWRQDGRSIFFARSTDGGATWSQNRNVTSGWGYRYDPAIAIDGSGRLYVTWCEYGEASDIFVSTSSDDGDTWSDPVRVTDDTTTNAYQYHPTIATLAAGNAVVAWVDGRDNTFHIYAAATSDGGVTWSPNRRVDDKASTNGTYAPTIATTPNGHVHIAWYDYRNGNADIYAASSNDAGLTWSTNVRVDDDLAISRQDSPLLLATTDGTLWSIWRDWRASEHIRMAASSDDGATWTSSTQVDDSTGDTDMASPILSGHSDNALVALWLDFRDGNYDLRAASSADAGSTWSSSSQVNQDDIGRAQQYNVRLAVGDHGNALAAWRDYQGYSGSRLYAAFRPVTGTWGSNIRIDATNDSQYSPDLLTDG
ncbi:MAG TPA: exo-alpha-sialidase, partial [Anaerolineae bacterium]|nr:exo-alpha-sialidase [Anaerolineae bacterium]